MASILSRVLGTVVSLGGALLRTVGYRLGALRDAVASILGRVLGIVTRVLHILAGGLRQHDRRHSTHHQRRGHDKRSHPIPKMFQCIPPLASFETAPSLSRIAGGSR